MKRFSTLNGFLFPMLILFFLVLSPSARAAETSPAVQSQPERIVSIRKFTTQAGKEMPLSNVSFDLYLVATTKQLETGHVTLHAQPTQQELIRYRTASGYVTTLVTDEQGCAQWNFTDHGLPDGIYLLIEHYSTAASGVTHPFYLTIPGTSPDGSPVYIQEVRSNAASTPVPTLDVSVTSHGCTSDSFDIGDEILWLLRVKFPTGTLGASYTITDSIDYRMTYQPSTPIVTLSTAAGEELSLQEGTHYLLTEDILGYGETTNRVTVTLTPETISYLSSQQDTGDPISELHIAFRAILNENTPIGIEIPNSAYLSYETTDGSQANIASNIVQVHTGALLLQSGSTEATSPSETTFRLARPATPEEQRDPRIKTPALYLDGKAQKVVFTSFYPTADLSTEKVQQITLSSGTSASMYGLAYGTYYLVPVQSASSVFHSVLPLCVEVNAASHTTPLVLQDSQFLSDFSQCFSPISNLSALFFSPLFPVFLLFITILGIFSLHRKKIFPFLFPKKP